MNHFYNLNREQHRFYIALVLLMLPFAQAVAQTFPAGFSRVQVASGISNPTVMAFAPDGRIFVAQQNGTLRIIKNGTLLTTPFLQLSVNSSGERGLIGIALDPQFSSNQFVYVYYTLPDGSRNRISRFTGNGDVVVAGSEVVLLNLDPLSSATNHNGGAMHFKNGLLYVAIGENANGANAQNLDTYHGKLLRINPDGSVPAGNPFTSGSEQRRRVWAYGLRNPYTFSIQPSTGRVFVNDVGQSTWEEINDATTGGQNFGWPTAEGTSTNPSFSNPVYAYAHGSGDGKGCAITGGVFFNPSSTNYPSEFTGRYFFQDLCNRWINMLDLSTSPATRLPFATGLGGDALSIDVGLDGNLYYLERSTGALYKIIYTNNTAPSIVTQPTALTVSAGQPASFSVTATGTAPLNYQWQKNNVNIAGANASTYNIPSVQTGDAGDYRVIVSNAAGSATSNNAHLTVTTFNAPPVAQIITPAEGTKYRGGDVISFSGSATDAEDGALPASVFTWLVHFHHDTHYHDGPPVASGSKTGTFTIPTSGEVSANVWYRLLLIVKDSQGLQDTVYRDIYPYTSVISLATVPTGLQVTLDGQPVTTPYSTTSVEGIIRPIGPVSPQTSGNATFVFSQWLHGGSAVQNLPTPTDDVTYTAVYLREPDNVLSPSAGLNFNYYEGSWSTLPDFNTSSPLKTGTTSTPDLSARNRTEDYAFTFSGYIDVPSDGLYHFYTNSDDGSKLFIGNLLIVNNDGLHGAQEKSGAIGLKKGKHPVTIQFFQHLGGAVLSVSYDGPGIAKQSIPSTAFYRPSDFSPITLEAEQAVLSGAIVQKNHPGYTGTGFADYVNATADYVQWSANVPATATYNLVFRYALNAGTRNMKVEVNGTTVQASLPFTSTGSWSTWGTVSIQTSLQQGANAIRVTAISNSGPNIDNLVIQASGTTQALMRGEVVMGNEASAKREWFSIYPNPAQREIHVDLPSRAGEKIKVQLLGLQGQVYQTIAFTSTAEETHKLSIPVEGYAQGMYLISIQQAERNETRLIAIGFD
jgi:glucose/arabinose dehydrogenase